MTTAVYMIIFRSNYWTLQGRTFVIQQPEALWVRVLKALYFPRTDFFRATGHHRPSWIWGSIMKGRVALLKGLRKNVGNGCDTWVDEAWFPGSEDFRCQTTPNLNCRIADCVTQDRRQWDVRKLRSLFAKRVVQEILLIPIGPPTRKDKWIWHYDTKGNFSIRSCYRLMKTGSNEINQNGNSQRGEWKWIWQLSIPPKVRIFVWKLCSNLLLVKANLMRRHCAPDPICPCCNLYDETVGHLLVECEVTKEIWKVLLPEIVPPGPKHSTGDWLFKMVKDGKADACAKAALCCWVIWRTRNEKSFQSLNPSQQGMKTSLSLEINLWNRGRSRETEVIGSEAIIDRLVTNQQRDDQMSRNPTWRFLCDGSFKKEVRKAGTGVIVVNPEGRIVDRVACQFLCRDPMVAEAYVVLTACKLAARGRFQAEIWSDCKQVVQACLSVDDDGPWECSSLIAEVKEILSECPFISVVNCRREGVNIADKVAKKVREHLLEPN